MVDNEVSGEVKNEENEKLQPKTPTLNSILAELNEVDGEMKTFDKKSGGLVLEENNSHNTGNESTFDTSQNAYTNSEAEIEPCQKEQPVMERKNEWLTSELQSVSSIPSTESKQDNIIKKEITAEEMGQEKSEIILSSQSLNPSTPSSIGQSFMSSRQRHHEKYLLRNQSDILPSLKEIPKDEDASLMIFSHKGLPTKKYFKRRDANSSILPFGFDERDVLPTHGHKDKVELTPKISQTVPKVEEGRKMHVKPLSDKNPNVPTNPTTGISRNVLTGRGVNSLDEFKNKSSRRKDGNPLLGIGYDEPVIPKNTGRVPPGGFSSGLW